MILVHPTDRDLLTALEQNNTDLHQTRVPGLEFGTGQHYSTQAAEVLLNKARAYVLYPTRPSGFSSHLVGTEQLLAEHGGCVARPNRSESWVLPLRQSVASRHVIAADAVLGEFEEKVLHSKKH